MEVQLGSAVFPAKDREATHMDSLSDSYYRIFIAFSHLVFLVD